MLECQAMVPPNNGGSTANNQKSRDMTLFGSNSKAIGAYKYPTLFYRKGNKSAINVLKNSKCWGIKSVIKVRRVLLPLLSFVIIQERCEVCKGYLLNR